MSKDNGGPAFPLANSNAEYMNTSRQECNGMTMRDYFAAKALPLAATRFTQDYTSQNGNISDYLPSQNYSDAAAAAYALADAMLAERAK